MICECAVINVSGEKVRGHAGHTLLAAGCHHGTVSSPLSSGSSAAAAAAAVVLSSCADTRHRHAPSVLLLH